MTTSRSDFNPHLEFLPDYAGLLWEYPDEHPDPEDQKVFGLLEARYSYLSRADSEEEPQWHWCELTHRLEPVVQYYVERRQR